MARHLTAPPPSGGAQRQSLTQIEVGAADDLGGLMYRLVAYERIAIGQRALGGIQPCGDGREPLDFDDHSPLTVKQVDGCHTR